MPILRIEHGVREYEAWKRAFDSDPVGREAGGVRGYRIVRPNDDPAYVMVDLDFVTLVGAERFLVELREPWGGVGTALGLESPHARIVELVESLDD